MIKHLQMFLTFCTTLCLLVTSFYAPAHADWKADWEKTLEAARKEGTVTIYGPPGIGFINAIETFKSVYPDIKMVYSPGASQHLPRISAERRAGKFLVDVYVGGSGSGSIMSQRGFFQPLQPLLILPESADPSGWYKKQHWFADYKKSQIIMQGNVTTTIAAYNTKKHKPGELKSHWDLLDPKWRGKLVSFDPTGRGALGAWKGAYYNKNLGAKFIQRLFSEMDVTIARDFRMAVDWIASGKYEFNVKARGTEVGEAMKIGMPIDIFRAPPEEGYMSGGFGHLAVMSHAPHPNAAAVFANWLLSREGQTAWQIKSDNNSMRMDIPKDMLTDKFSVPQPGGEYLVSSLPEYRDVSDLRKIVAKARADAAKAAKKRR